VAACARDEVEPRAEALVDRLLRAERELADVEHLPFTSNISRSLVVRPAMGPPALDPLRTPGSWARSCASMVCDIPSDAMTTSASTSLRCFLSMPGSVL
jgi:hypothetical protein